MCHVRVRLALLALALLAPVATVAAAVETLRIGGSGKGMGTMRLLGSAFERERPGVKVLVVPELGTSGGFKALSKNAIDVLVSNRPLLPKEASPAFVEMVYARAAFVLVTSASQSVDSLTLSELADMYAGRRSTWPDGTAIRLVLRPSAGADTMLLRQFSPAVDAAVQIAQARPGMLNSSSDQETLRLVERVPGAIGVSTLASVRLHIPALKALALNGVTPGPDTLANGSYPHYVPMRMVRKRGAGPAVQQFFDFVKSPAGGAVLLSVGNWVPAE